jgi:hypothetical protein
MSVNVQALRLEYKSGWRDFFRSEPRMGRAALDRFTIEVAADAASSDVSELIEGIAALSDIVPSHYKVRDDDGSSESGKPDSPALDIWV